MSVSPSQASVLLGATQQFTATASNTSNTAVTWSVNSIPGGNSTVGTISTSGLYTAPQDLPAQGPINVQASSQVDPSKTGTATVSVMSDLSVTLAPATANVELGALRQFQAAVFQAIQVERSAGASPGRDAAARPAGPSTPTGSTPPRESCPSPRA